MRPRILLPPVTPPTLQDTFGESFWTTALSRAASPARNLLGAPEIVTSAPKPSRVATAAGGLRG